MKRKTPHIVNKKKIFGFDVETEHFKQDGYTEQQFLMGSVVGDKLKEVFWDQQEMAKFLVTNRHVRDGLVMATNLEFDLIHVFQGTKYEKQIHFIPKQSIIAAIYRKYHKDKTRKDGVRSHTVKFIDTMNYIPMGVEKLGNMFNIPKLPKPKAFCRRPETEEEKQELIDYNIRDSEVSMHFGKFIQNFCNELGAKMQLTCASLGMDLWRRKFQPCDLFQERRSWLDKHYEGSVHGGRTEIFKRGRVKNAYYFDFNSHYPARCYEGLDGNGSYPNPNAVYYRKENTMDIINEFEGITKVTFISPNRYIPLLGITVDNKYIFPTGEFTSWFTNVEIRKALEIGYELKNIGEGIYYTENFVPFRDCIKTLYSLRRQYQREGNAPMEKMVKTVMNGGIFGKFAQKINNKIEMFSIDNMESDASGDIYVWRDDKKIRIDDYVIRGRYLYQTIAQPAKPPLFVFPILASYTTAMARIMLWEYMNKHQADMIYCDTDSLVLKRNAFKTSTKLGDLKLEYRIKDSLFIKPKLYYTFDGDKYSFKAKGVPNRYLDNTEAFLNMLNAGVDMERFTKLKESAVRKMPFSSVVKMTKTMDLEDTKRKWKQLFSFNDLQDSHPLFMTS